MRTDLWVPRTRSFGASIRYLQQQGWRQIDIPADEMARRSPGWSCSLIGGVLQAECEALCKAKEDAS